MGGLIGGSFASGMDAAELDTMLGDINWDEMFGVVGFQASRTSAARTTTGPIPRASSSASRSGIVPPTSLNDGEQVELLLGRIRRALLRRRNFDDLPTPFRPVAVDCSPRPRSC
jgi:NTE family protein